MNDVKSILIVGVGGQGTLLASRLLGNALLSRDYDVKVSEVHGMSQRGGSPIIEQGEADIILSFEALEAARFLPYLKKGGKIIVNTQQIDPMPVVTGNASYPEDILGQIKALGVDVIAADALSLAEQAGSAKAVNVVLMGMLAKQSDIEKQVWLDTVEQTVPPKFLELNLKAFELGYTQ